MNYYPFHIGDYAAHTGHLDELSDLAYRRLLDRYYLTEKPLPADAAECAKVTRLREHIVVVQAVLEEFFELHPEGWRHTRVDEELLTMQSKQATVEARDEHEQTRQQKHRERRAGLFAQLADVGVYPAYNTKTSELETLVATHCDTNATRQVTQSDATGDAPVTPSETPVSLCSGDTCDATGDARDVTGDEPATASHVRACARLPTPTPTPTPKKKEESTRKRAPAPPDPCPEDVDPQVWGDWLALRRKKRAPVTETVLREARAEAEKAGLTFERFLAVWCARGSQGLQADWLTPNERSRPAATPAAEPEWRRQQRERVQQAAPYVAARPRAAAPETFDAEDWNRGLPQP